MFTDEFNQPPYSVLLHVTCDWSRSGKALAHNTITISRETIPQIAACLDIFIFKGVEQFELIAAVMMKPNSDSLLLIYLSLVLKLTFAAK